VTAKRGHAPARGLALALAVVLPACATTGVRTSSHGASPSLPPVLAADAVPGIASTTRPLDVVDLAKDASISGLASTIGSFGFVAGRERTFQGQSKHLTYVVSRALAFASVDGARRFVAYVRSRAASFFGVGTTARQLVADGRTGWLFDPPACACHLANPVLVAVLGDGAGVVWLEINGPEASRAVLLRLLRPSAAG
jgi:hypothetical protein